MGRAASLAGRRGGRAGSVRAALSSLAGRCRLSSAADPAGRLGRRCGATCRELVCGAAAGGRDGQQRADEQHRRRGRSSPGELGRCSPSSRSRATGSRAWPSTLGGHGSWRASGDDPPRHHLRPGRPRTAVHGCDALHDVVGCACHGLHHSLSGGATRDASRVLHPDCVLPGYQLLAPLAEATGVVDCPRRWVIGLLGFAAGLVSFLLLIHVKLHYSL